jgi:alpha-L-arabinofuranosidase
VNRRTFLQAAALPAAQNAADAVVVDPRPLFDISPYLYMQFMEPLGVTDSSVEAAWDYDRDDWRADFVETVRDLAPDVIRFGGLFSRYYRWREGIGPAEKRPLMRNYVWGGKETNRVGTDEFVDLCRRVGAEPLYCVNFLSDGQKRYRAGDAQEAAEWVSYASPLGVRLWQIGNETSYGNETFSRDEAIAHTIEFARAMKQRDASIQLIGWGDRGGDGKLWAGEMLRRAGEHLDYIAIHMMGQSPTRARTALYGNRYQQEPAQAWDELIELSRRIEQRVSEVEAETDKGIAITEGHLSLRPHNANPILTEWLSAVYHARSYNIYQRHGARVKMATAADFQGNRWTVNAVMIQTPGRLSYLTPAGSVARLFKRHNGKQGVAVTRAPSSLDIAASRTDGKVYLHVASLEYARSTEATFAVEGRRVTGGRVFAIAPGNLRENVSPEQPKVFDPRETALTGVTWRFPAGSVSVVELDLA